MRQKEADAGALLSGVALVSASLMATEIAMTRVLSVTVWYHFAFFAISVALLGTGLAALLVHALSGRGSSDGLRRACAPFAFAQALSTLLVAFGMTHVTPDWFGGMTGIFTLFTWKLGLVFLLAVLPFACGGLVLASAALRFGRDVHRMYFMDLVGAACGCVLTIPLLSLLGGPRALVACAGIATLASAVLAFAGSAKRPRARLSVSFALLSALALEAVCIVTPVLDLRAAKGIDLTVWKPELTRWNSFSLVNVFGQQGFRGWGLSPRYMGPLPEQKTLVIDMSALTPIARFDGDFGKVAYVQYDLSALVYRTFAAERAPAQVCVVGAGGGKDVLSALASGAKHVTGVEINPLITNDVMRGVYRDFSGNLYGREDVSLVEADGRSFLRATERRFGVILISMVDTSAATAAGAYALTENGLYTRQAFEEFLTRLEPGGVLTVSTVSLPGLAVGARLTAVARAALLARGARPERAIAVVHTPWVTRHDAELYDLLIKPDGFSDAELERLRAAIDKLGFVPALVPGGVRSSSLAEDVLINSIVRAPNEAELARTLAAFPADASAVDDDRPFFFYQNRLGDFLGALLPVQTTHLFGNGLAVLAKLLLLSFAILLASLFVPRLWQRGAATPLSDRLYVLCLGLGFMCVEIALVHRVTLFLGQPTYTLVAVLFVLLCAGGAGSRLLSRRFGASERSGVVGLLVVAIAIAALPFLTQISFDAARAASLTARAAVAVAVIAPLGFLLGAPLPACLARVAERDADRIPWLWAVNGSASVFGSIFATLLALHAGTRATLLFGAAAYLMAAWLWRRLHR